MLRWLPCLSSRKRTDRWCQKAAFPPGESHFEPIYRTPVTWRRRDTRPNSLLGRHVRLHSRTHRPSPSTQQCPTFLTAATPVATALDRYGQRSVCRRDHSHRDRRRTPPPPSPRVVAVVILFAPSSTARAPDASIVANVGFKVSVVTSVAVEATAGSPHSRWSCCSPPAASRASGVSKSCSRAMRLRSQRFSTTPLKAATRCSLLQAELAGRTSRECSWTTERTFSW